MNLTESFKLYKQDKSYQAHIDTIIDMCFELWQEGTVEEEFLIEVMTKLAGAEVARHIMALVIQGKTTFVL